LTWKGKFIFDTRASVFLRLTGAWGPGKTLAYLRKLGRNEPIFVRGQTKAARILNGWLGSKGYRLMEDINRGWSAPFPGSRKEKFYKGKTIAFPPTPEQVPDRPKYTLEMLKAVGARKSK